MIVGSFVKAWKKESQAREQSLATSSEALRYEVSQGLLGNLK